jgi:site-specific DNA-cytosine methylase
LLGLFILVMIVSLIILPLLPCMPGWVQVHAGRLLQVATDCSGFGSPLHALRLLGVRFRHVWASEPDPSARKMLNLHFPPERFAHSVFDHNVLELPRRPDLYIAGFPCQPFSRAGLRDGFEAPGGRVFFKIWDVLAATSPRAFVLENVSGLGTCSEGACMVQIMNKLRELRGYCLHVSEMNAKDHGVPQNRARIFFIGIRLSVARQGFQFPAPLPHRGIDQFLDTRLRRPCFLDLPPASATTARNNLVVFLNRIVEMGSDPFLETWILEVDASPAFAKAMRGCSPCLTRSRCQGHWISSRGRRMNLRETFRLFGFPEAPLQNVTETQMRMLLGNSMAVNVMVRLFVRLLACIGSHVGLQDPYDLHQ